jgi:hypothetical protein
MAIVIDKMTSQFDVHNPAKLRKLVAEEVKVQLAAQKKQKGAGSGGPDPSDPAASGRPGEGS